MAYSQPRFDHRIYALHGLLPSAHTGTSALNRGSIARADGSEKINFLYNPTTVTADYALQMDNASQVLFHDANDTSTPLMPLQQHVTFSILFDRTYELWTTGGGDGGSVAYDYGVEADVAALKAVVGMASPPGTLPGPDVGGNAAGGYDVMQPERVWIYIGGGAKQSLKYYGFIDSWTVTYTHWNQDTIPMRCTLEVHATLLPRTSAGGVQNSGSSSTSAGTPAAPVPIGGSAFSGATASGSRGGAGAFSGVGARSGR